MRKKENRREREKDIHSQWMNERMERQAGREMEEQIKKKRNVMTYWSKQQPTATGERECIYIYI